MISLLESAKLADGRNILNFSVDTVDAFFCFRLTVPNGKIWGTAIVFPQLEQQNLKTMQQRFKEDIYGN